MPQPGLATVGRSKWITAVAFWTSQLLERTKFCHWARRAVIVALIRLAGTRPMDSRHANTVEALR